MSDKIINENYVLIQGWMINELKLKGNELLIYALIYGFSQAENQTFTGSLQYLSKWTNSTKQGVIKNLKSLIDKNYIVKNERYINNVKFCEYYSTKLNGVLNKVEWGIKQSLPNNIDNNTNNINNKKERKKETTSYDAIINELVKDEDVKKVIYEFIKMRNFIKKPLTDNALSLLIKKLYTLSSNKDDQIEILNNSIINNWQDIYKKENKNGVNKSRNKSDGSEYADI